MGFERALSAPLSVSPLWLLFLPLCLSLSLVFLEASSLSLPRLSRSLSGSPFLSFPDSASLSLLLSAFLLILSLSPFLPISQTFCFHLSPSSFHSLSPFFPCLGLSVSFLSSSVSPIISLSLSTHASPSLCSLLPSLSVSLFSLLVSLSLSPSLCASVDVPLPPLGLAPLTAQLPRG